MKVIMITGRGKKKEYEVSRLYDAFIQLTLDLALSDDTVQSITYFNQGGHTIYNLKTFAHIVKAELDEANKRIDLYLEQLGQY